MIYTTIDNLNRYLGMHENLDKAIHFLTGCDLTALHDGRNEVAGDDVYVNVFEYDTIPDESGIWEAHVLYGDIHIDISGAEKIGVTDVSELTETSRKEADDFVGYDGPVRTWAPLAPGLALVVFPEDAHMVKIQDGGIKHVRKAVVKFRA